MKPSWTQRIEERALAKGRAAGIAWSIMALLQKRGLSLTEEQRLVLSNCQNIEQLEGWLLRAAEVASVSELLPAQIAPVPEDELTTAEDRVEQAYQRLEQLLLQRVSGVENSALEAKIQAQFDELSGLKQARADAIERAHREPGVLEEFKDALEEAKRLVSESEEARRQ